MSNGNDDDSVGCDAVARPVRGGCLITLGRDCRSPCRFRVEYAFRLRYCGFRLSLRMSRIDHGDRKERE